MTGMVWSEEDKNRVSALWAEGKSAREIASEFNGKSRNAIIGLLHRMNAPKRARPEKVTSLKRERPQQKKSTAFFVLRKQSQKNKVTPIQVPPPLSVTSGDGFTLKQLRENQCRDVIGYRNGNLSEPIYCGAEKYQNTSFCEYHKSIYMFPPKRKLG